MNSKLKTQDARLSKVLVTGAAGFIGSNLVEALIARGAEVVGVDNFITGKRENIEPFRGQMEFVEGDLREIEICRRCCKGVDFVLHEAALGSVPRSVADPVTTHEHNVNVTLNMLVAAREAGVKRFVYAASSSAYGEAAGGAKAEDLKSAPLSPYAVSKLVGELYAGVFHRNYGLETVALRYFNVFGPRQDPQGQYAAVIPRFITAVMRGERPVIFGDGEQTRDFTYVDNVVEANLLACTAPKEACGQMFNIGAGGETTVNDLFRGIAGLLGSTLTPEYATPRQGDIRHSSASVEKARHILGYEPKIDVGAGLGKTVEWYRKNTI